MKNAPEKCFYGAFLPFAFHSKPVLATSKMSYSLVARIRLLWILEVLIQLRIAEIIAVVFTRTGYFLALQNLGSKSVSTSAISLKRCSVEMYE